MKGLPWIEGNDWPLAKVDTLYYDDHHLRGVGAKLYSEWLAEQVQAILAEPDRISSKMERDGGSR